jgi:hypothetical protein
VDSNIKTPLAFLTPVIIILFLGSFVFADDPKTYISHDFKFSFMIPSEWKLYGEQKGESGLIVGYSLPPIWSDLEKENIENAVDIIASRRSGFQNLEQLIVMDKAQKSEWELSREEVPSALGRAFTIITRRDGNKYKSRTTYRYANGIGYMISFTATEGTFDKNLHQYAGFLRTFQIDPDYRSGAIKSASGYLLVWNQPGNYYTLEIMGKNVKQTSQDQIYFAVDGKFLQIVTTEYDSFYKKEAGKTADPKAILEAHRDWEISYRENEEGAGKKLAVQSTWHLLDNGRNALLWEFDNPLKSGQNVKRQIFLSTVKGDRVLLLNGGTTEGTIRGDVVSMLLEIMSSLKTSIDPIDLNNIAK